MKLPLFLFALAALLSWASVALQSTGQTAIIGAQRAQPPEPARVVPAPGAAAAAAAPEIAMDAPAPGPGLFRPATLPAALREPAPGEHFRLVGLAGATDARIAFLRDEVGARAFTARLGEQVLDWTVEAIEPRCVVLRRAAQRETICLS